MKAKELSKKLKGDPKFIPFNDNFDYGYIINFLKENIEDINDKALFEKACCLIYFNDYYLLQKKCINEVIEGTGLAKHKLLEILIHLTNRDYLLIQERLNDTLSKSNYIDFEKISNFSIQSKIRETDKFNAQSAIEAGLDSLNVLLNIIGRAKYNSTETTIKAEHIDECFRLLGFINICNVVKHAYETTVWEDYNVQYHLKESELHIHCSIDGITSFNIIGEHRTEKNLYASKNYILSNYLGKGHFYKMMFEALSKKRRAKRLKAVEIINSLIHFKLSDGIDKESVFRELMIHSDLTTYYAYIGDEPLPNFNNLTLHDIVTLFSEIQALIGKVVEINRDEGKKEILKSYELFKIYINPKNLLEYLISKTIYNPKQISQVIKLLEQNGKDYNIYERPLIPQNDVLIPVLLPIVSPNNLRLIEYWLEEGGFDLDRRGKLFEGFIKKEIKLTFQKKRFSAKVIDKNVFENRLNIKEEIDLIIELKTVIVIVEIKCVRYPFNPRDYHNMYKRLSEGSKQIKRKADFIKANYADFHADFMDIKKEIIPIVITNYPIFTGVKISDMPIIDFSLLENYFTGYYNRSIYARLGNEIKVAEKKEPIVYYTNETEFSNNIKNFFFNVYSDPN